MKKRISPHFTGKIATMKANIKNSNGKGFDGDGYVFKTAIRQLRKEGYNILRDKSVCSYFLKSILIVLLCSTVAHAEPWEGKDKALMAGYAVLSGIDAYQTGQISHKKGLREANPLLTGSDGQVDMKKVIGFKVLSLAGVYLLAEYVPSYRTGILSVACGIQGGVVAWNLQFE